ncbi:MAG: LysR substrate-binding domain-containing protein [bacterium]|jgi:LysR family hydrogen peroxide-inducible transcriptional activator|nr:LysR family transcriptional regulator [Rhodocyclaceae bacterium]
MTLTELRYIVALARERHFARAAAACFVSQPTLSVAVKRLEDELGLPLFERGTGEVTTTPIGEQIIAQAQRVLEQATVIHELARSGKDPLSGPLRLAAIHTIAPYLLPLLVRVLVRRAPRMPLILEEGYTHELLERLRHGDIDAAVVALPIHESGLVQRDLYDEPFQVAMPASHAWARHKRIDAARLKEETMLLLGAGHCLRDQVLEVCPEAARFSSSAEGIRRTFEGTSLETIRQMVASGLGITVIPASALPAQTRRDDLIVYRPFQAPAPMRRIVIACRRSYARTAAIDAVANAVRETELPGVRMLA